MGGYGFRIWDDYIRFLLYTRQSLHGDCNTNFHRHYYSYSNFFTDAHQHPYGYSNPNIYTYSNTILYSNSYFNSDEYSNSNTNFNTYNNCHH